MIADEYMNTILESELNWTLSNDCFGGSDKIMDAVINLQVGYTTIER